VRIPRAQKIISLHPRPLLADFFSFLPGRGLSFLASLPYHTEQCLGNNPKPLEPPLSCAVGADLLMYRLV
jgi:hypothetical protein